METSVGSVDVGVEAAVNGAVGHSEIAMETSVGSVDAGVEAAVNGAVGSPPAIPCHTIAPCSVGPAAVAEATLGRHLARRLAQVGAHDVFSVPGDFNLTLLDHLLDEPGLCLIGCCNELNAGYAADGYERARGVGACVVTFTVGCLSVLNAIAGAYSENLPVIYIVGGPNTNDYSTNRILQHTIGLADFSQERARPLLPPPSGPPILHSSRWRFRNV